VTWVILQPLMAAGVFTFVFGKVAALPSEGVPYFVFSYAGMLGWNLFSSTVTKFSTSLVANAGLVSKIFFPRLVLPLSTLGSTLLDFAVASGMMAVILAVAGARPSVALATLPLWAALALLLGGGLGLLAAALMVKYRDVGYVLPVAMQILLYATPIAYSLARVPAGALLWVKLNPLTGVMVGFRWSLLGTSRPDTLMVTWSAGVACALFAAGAAVFARMERQFADVI
jgi:lipopolysaccharide transport system permease protein